MLGKYAFFIIIILAAPGLSFPADITVKVTDGSLALEDASLTIPELKENLLSDDKGICVFKNVGAGSYTLYAILAGYEKYSNTIEVKSENLNIDIRLKQSVYSLGEINVD